MASYRFGEELLAASSQQHADSCRYIEQERGVSKIDGLIVASVTVCDRGFDVNPSCKPCNAEINAPRIKSDHENPSDNRRILGYNERPVCNTVYFIASLRIDVQERLFDISPCGTLCTNARDKDLWAPTRVVRL